MPKKYKNHSERLLSKVEVDDNGCWLWTGSKNKKGYGQVFYNSKLIKAHRFSYEVFKEPIPKGMHVCHSCDIPSCINPDHLWVGTAKDNMIDMGKKGRTVNQNTNKTHCKQGHEFSPENTYYYSQGRQCRICQRIRNKESKRKKRKMP